MGSASLVVGIIPNDESIDPYDMWWRVEVATVLTASTVETWSPRAVSDTPDRAGWQQAVPHLFPEETRDGGFVIRDEDYCAIH